MAERADGAGRGTTRRGGGGRTTRSRAAGGRSTTTRTKGTAAGAKAAAKAGDVTRPERSVVKDPPPAPDYPRWRVEPGTRIRLADVDPDESEHYQRKKDVADELKHHRDRIADLQARLYGEQRRSLLIVLQAMDTGGKDGTIKGVFQGVNPQGCQVWSFKAPSNEEAAHDFLWRYHQKAPSKGMIHIFNRSHYEDVLIVRVKDLVPESVWQPRYEAINQFEYALTSDGVTVLKFFLQRPQGTRLLGRLPGGVRGRGQRVLDQLRPLVRGPGQQEVVPKPGRGPDHRRHPGGHGPPVPGRREGPGEGRDPRLSAEPSAGASVTDGYRRLNPRPGGRPRTAAGRR